MYKRLILGVLSLGFVDVAHAWIYVGNPKLTVEVNRPEGDFVSGSVDLHQVRMHLCAGGYTTYAVD